MPEDTSVTKIDETSTKEYLPVSLFKYLSYCEHNLI